jgi:hypothetical protein
MNRKFVYQVGNNKKVKALKILTVDSIKEWGDLNSQQTGNSKNI